ncbi:butyrophilin subfamily 1 member A1-like [Emydura macquarii macquarii]|uniref:butyrophilin subfamily 1 member A1-like n=1 Tax=Emydura macquarii macquarii TaxID=1129001 RepID=UPI00352ADBAF
MMMGKVPSFSNSSTGYIALCLTLQAHGLASAQFTVTGPDHPITASVGGEAVLTCRLSPTISAENMEVRWFRSKYSPFVHLYRDGQDQYGEQMPEYRRRTELLKDDIENGRVSLRIHNIRPSDDGQYKCFFQSGVFYEEALLGLKVAGLGSAPSISVEGHQDRGIRMVCQSSGWYPETKVVWRDLRGQLLPSAPETISQESDGLYQTEITIVITEKSNQKVSCCVRNPLLNQERESTIYIAELFFPRVNAWMVALGVILALLIVLIALASYCFWRQHRVKDKLQAELRWRIAQLYAVDMTLDPDTAHPNLVLSKDHKTVTYEDKRQDLPDNTKRFNTYPIVLGAKGFTGGRSYWEVEVRDKTNWTVGVCRDSVIRTGKNRLTPENGFWTVWLRHGKYEACTSSHRTLLPVSVRPTRVGISLDYEVGEVSFYNVTDGSQLFTFTDTLSGMLCPYFFIGYKEEGKNVAPLIICPVPAQARENLS